MVSVSLIKVNNSMDITNINKRQSDHTLSSVNQNNNSQDVFVKKDSIIRRNKLVFSQWALPQNIEKEIVDNIDSLEKNPDKANPNIQKIGQGSFGGCYKIKLSNPGKLPSTIVVKKDLKEDKDSEQIDISFLMKEVYILEDVSKFSKNVPKPIGLFKKDDNYYLGMTFMEGKEPDPKNNPFTVDHLKSLMNTLFKFDQNGILHGDLGCRNILLTLKEANLIDFGYSRTFIPDKLFEKDKEYSNENAFFKKSFNPHFPLISNVECFEPMGLYSYLEDMSEISSYKEIRKFFIDYLKLKSDYHLDQIKLLKEFKEKDLEKISNKNFMPPEKLREMLDKAIEYEELQVKLLKNPSDTIVDIEAAKIQLKYFILIKNRFEDDKDAKQAIENRHRTYFIRLANKIDMLIEKTDKNTDEGKYYRNVKKVIEKFQKIEFDGIPRDLSTALYKQAYDKEFNPNPELGNVAEIITQGKFKDENDKKQYELDLEEEKQRYLAKYHKTQSSFNSLVSSVFKTIVDKFH